MRMRILVVLFFSFYAIVNLVLVYHVRVPSSKTKPSNSSPYTHTKEEEPWKTNYLDITSSLDHLCHEDHKGLLSSQNSKHTGNDSSPKRNSSCIDTKNNYRNYLVEPPLEGLDHNGNPNVPPLSIIHEYIMSLSISPPPPLPPPPPVEEGSSTLSPVEEESGVLVNGRTEGSYPQLREEEEISLHEQMHNVQRDIDGLSRIRESLQVREAKLLSDLVRKEWGYLHKETRRALKRASSHQCIREILEGGLLLVDRESPGGGGDPPLSSSPYKYKSVKSLAPPLPPGTKSPISVPPMESPPPELRLAFGLLVHNNKLQIEKIIRALIHRSTLIVIHIDRDASPVVVSDICALVKSIANPSIFILPYNERVGVTWSGWSMVQAELNIIHHLYSDHHGKWDYFINLSAADYPVKTIDYMLRYIKERAPSNFIETYPAGGEPGYQNHENWFFVECDNHVFNIGPRQSQELFWEKFPSGEPDPNIFYRGSQWMALSLQFVEWMLETDREWFELYTEWWRHALFSDESFFPTLISHSPFNDTKKDRVTCLRWDKSLKQKEKQICQHIDEGDWCGWSPKTLDARAAAVFFEDPDCLLARKFNIDSGYDLLSEMEWKIGRLAEPGFWFRARGKPNRLLTAHKESRAKSFKPDGEQWTQAIPRVNKEYAIIKKYKRAALIQHEAEQQMQMRGGATFF